jgi:uncharacterized membrane protein
MKPKNKSSKTSSKIASKTAPSAILLVIICTLFTASGQYFIKKGLSNAGAKTSLLAYINMTMIGGLILYGLGALLLIWALRKGSLSVLYPLISLGFIWAALLGLSFLGETVSLLNWIGIVGIIMGVSIIGGSDKLDKTI